jgi:hypothetical protein
MIQAPGPNVIKLVIKFLKKARVFVPGKFFEASLTNTLA